MRSSSRASGTASTPWYPRQDSGPLSAFAGLVLARRPAGHRLTATAASNQEPRGLLAVDAPLVGRVLITMVTTSLARRSVMSVIGGRQPPYGD